MRHAGLILAFLLLPFSSEAQIPPGADTLANWQPPGEVTTYTDNSDTLHVLGDSTWVAIQEQITIGCELGPDGDPWVFRPSEEVNRLVKSADTSYSHRERLMAFESCLWWVQVLWRYEEGFLP